MSYTIKRYNGTQVAVVADGTINTSLDITLIGKSYAGYGAAQNENFLYLLENFANPTQPAKPITGQIWFDSGNNKLKFFDKNGRFRTAGGAEIGATAPSGLTTGDFWFNTTTNQLFAWTGSRFNLVGPQTVSSTSVTQMVSTSVQDIDTGASHQIIQAVNNNIVVATISSDPDFTLSTLNPIPGFSVIRQGITLVYSNDESQSGQTTSNHRFWGTASDSDQLGGLPASSYVQAGSATFSSLVNFADVGFTVGNPIAKLKIFNASATTPTIYNQNSDTIQFQTTVSSLPKIPLVIKGLDLLPGTTSINTNGNLGSTTQQWNSIYANYVHGTASQADALAVGGGSYSTAATSATPGSVVIRTSASQTIGGQTITAGAIQASYFVGTATTAQYADVAEKYLADKEYEVGTVLMIGGEKEVTACQVGFRAVGPVSGEPAHLMNSQLVGGTAVALKGRVPVKVTGSVIKGQRMVAGPDGTAQAAMGNNSDVFAIALESNSDVGIKLVECLVL